MTVRSVRRRSRPIPEYRLQVPTGVLRLVAADDVVQVAEVVLHRLDFGETVERPHHEERIPQPAVAIVPVPARVRGFRDARGHCRDDRAGLLERAELQRDGGAGDRLLPLERQRETPGPPPPVRGGLLLELARGLLDAACESLVGAEEQAHRLLEQERSLVEHVGDGSVGVEPQCLTRVHVADVVRAVGDVGGTGTVVEARAHPDPDARRATGRTDPANQCGGPEGAPARLEPRREVGHDDAVPCTVHHLRFENRGVLAVALHGARLRRGARWRRTPHRRSRLPPSDAVGGRRRSDCRTPGPHRTAAGSTTRYVRRRRRGRRRCSCR